MHVMLYTRPDIPYAVSVTSKYSSDLGEDHWVAVKHIFKYLRRTKDMIMFYGRGDLHVDRLTNSNFQSDINDRKSALGFVFFFYGGAITWKSFEQDITTDSTIEGKYVTACDAAKEVA